MVSYTYNQQLIEIQESANQEDITFTIRVHSEEMRRRVKQLRDYFEDNKDLTDAMFYSLQDGRFEVIVRHNSYLLFLLHAFRFRCIESIAWK